MSFQKVKFKVFEIKSKTVSDKLNNTEVGTFKDYPHRCKALLDLLLLEDANVHLIISTHLYTLLLFTRLRERAE